MKKLDVGCGRSKRQGYIGIDQLALPGVDVVHNLNSFPYPFEDNEMSEVWLDNVLEHLENPLKAMEEIYRISRPGAKVIVSVPYGRSFYATIDPTHRAFFGVYWFHYLDPRHDFFKKYSYTHAKFQLDKREFDREYKGKPKHFFHAFMIWLAEKKPEAYEERFSHLYPLNSLTYYLTVVK